MFTVKEFRKGFKKIHTGFVDIFYWDLIITCEIVILKDRSKVWFKIPEYKNPETGKNCHMIRWRSKEISDAIQEEIRSELQDKFPEALIIPDIRKIRKESKKFAKKIKSEKKAFSQKNDST